MVFCAFAPTWIDSNVVGDAAVIPPELRFSKRLLALPSSADAGREAHAGSTP
jgi:hypothetical protein